MKIAERYTSARNTSSLLTKAGTTYSATDVLGAVGLAAQRHSDSMLMLDVVSVGNIGAKLRLVDSLARKLRLEIATRRIRSASNPAEVAKEVVAYLLHGTCQPCGGRGLEVVLGTGRLSDVICTHCRGAGKVRLIRTDAHTWLLAYCEMLVSIAERAVERKIKDVA